MGACPRKKYSTTRNSHETVIFWAEAPADRIEMKIYVGVDLADIVMDVLAMENWTSSSNLKISGISMSLRVKVRPFSLTLHVACHNNDRKPCQKKTNNLGTGNSFHPSRRT